MGGSSHLRVAPPRREGDALVLAKAFLSRFAEELKSPVKGFDQQAMEAIEAYDWPGNVRELESRVKRATIMADGTYLTCEDLALEPSERETTPFNMKQVREEAERSAIKRALGHCNDNITEAASALGITRPTLYNMME